MVSTAQKTFGLLLLLLPAVAAAQSEGTVVERRVTTEINGGKPLTYLTRTTSSRGRSRMDVSADGPLPDPWRTTGSTIITVRGDKGPTTTIVDSARKTYWTTNLGSLLRGALNTNVMKPIPSATHLSVDGAGDGGVVAGFHTVHFRSHLTTSMMVNLTGDPTTYIDTTTTDYYVAPGLRFDTLGATVGSGVNRSRSDTSRSHRPGLDTVLKQFVNTSNEDVRKARATIARLNKLGAVVRTVVETRVTVKDGVKVTRTTTDLVSHKTMIVPDSLFVAPAGYVKTMPGFMPVR